MSIRYSKMSIYRKQNFQRHFFTKFLRHSIKMKPIYLTNGLPIIRLLFMMEVPIYPDLTTSIEQRGIEQTMIGGLRHVKN